ncbi:MAG TPA: hypothetical protein VF893_02995, partial [Candidatus Bathyarchaeia archaeon]
CPSSVMPVKPLNFCVIAVTGEYGVARKVTKTNGAATKKGKFNGKELSVKRGMRKGRFPIIICRNFLENLPEKPNSLAAFPETRMTVKTYA